MKTIIIIIVSILFFTCQGPQGPAGVTGPAGATGPQGAAGQDSIFKCIAGDIVSASTGYLEIESLTPIKLFNVVFLLPDTADNWICVDCDITEHTSTNTIGGTAHLVYVYRLTGIIGAGTGKYKIPYMGDYVEWIGN